MSTIPTPLISSTAQAVTKRYLRVVHGLRVHPSATYFNAPVDASAGISMTEYNSIIKTPMDIGTILNNLEDHRYTTAELLYDDLVLTFQNAITFNGNDSWIFKHANCMLNLTRRRFADVVGNKALRSKLDDDCAEVAPPPESRKREVVDENEVECTTIKDKVTQGRDMPHARRDCSYHPFGASQPNDFCPHCYCSVCEVPALQCTKWMQHCKAALDGSLSSKRAKYIDDEAPDPSPDPPLTPVSAPTVIELSDDETPAPPSAPTPTPSVQFSEQAIAEFLFRIGAPPLFSDVLAKFGLNESRDCDSYTYSLFKHAFERVAVLRGEGSPVRIYAVLRPTIRSQMAKPDLRLYNVPSKLDVVVRAVFDLLKASQRAHLFRELKAHCPADNLGLLSQRLPTLQFSLPFRSPAKRNEFLRDVFRFLGKANMLAVAEAMRHTVATPAHWSAGPSSSAAPGGTFTLASNAKDIQHVEEQLQRARQELLDANVQVDTPQSVYLKKKVVDMLVAQLSMLKQARVMLRAQAAGSVG
jgi:hypothetical protein